MLYVYEEIPAGLLACEATDLHRILPGPSLIHLQGERTEPLFVSVLLHGNETTGWQAVRSVLQDFQARRLPRSLSLFIGNVSAAAHGVRHLDEQSDYNRIWKAEGHHAEDVMVRQILEQMRERNVFASIDIHNNTGRNPHYACINRLATPFFQLATLFSRTVVYFLKPDSVLSMAFAELCPSVTVECGRAVDEASVVVAAELIDAALSLQRFPGHPVPHGDIDLMQTFAVIKVPAGVSFSFDGSDAEFCFRSDLDRLNFSELSPGTVFGSLGGSRTRRLDVLPASDFAPAGGYFDYADRQIRLSQSAIPAMLTLDPDAVRLDCLGYLMCRIGRDGRPILE